MHFMKISALIYPSFQDVIEFPLIISIFLV